MPPRGAGREPMGGRCLPRSATMTPGQRYVIIIDRTTLDWLGKPGSLSYFPVHGTLPATVVANLDRAFPVHHVFQDTYIAELECP